MRSNESKKNSKKLFLYLLVGFLAILSVVLLILPANFFDAGQSICVSVLLFKKVCYGCGMTRAVQHLIHLDFMSAYHYNKLSFIVFPLLIFLVLQELRKLYLQSK